MQKIIAWGVHTFTSLGLVAGFMALLAVQDHDWRSAMLWLIVAFVIDGVDGTLARSFKVKEALPGIDGKTIDYVIDFANYAIVPAYMFYESSIVPKAWNLPLTIVILVVSALYYGRDTMTSEDRYFIGFPVLWNFVLFYYIFITDYEPMTYVVVTLFISILHFVPIKVAYPSQNRGFKIPSLIVLVVLGTTMLVAVYYYPEKIVWVTVSAYVALLYFTLLTVYTTWIE